MTLFGYHNSHEQFSPADLLRYTVQAEQAGFNAAFCSDHIAPWSEAQGESGFNWSWLGAAMQATSLPFGSFNAPGYRYHPAIIAQAIATLNMMFPERLFVAFGSGEALNEHILGDPWPHAARRLAMLEESIEVMRRLWEGGTVSHRGEFYTVDTARLYTLPEEPPKVYMSAFGPKATALAARVADGLVQVSPAPDTIADFREQGGSGPVQGGLKVCWAEDEGEAVRTAYERWPTEALVGEASQLLPSPRHFEQLTSGLVTPEMVAEQVPCGPDPEEHVAAFEPYLEAGADEVYVCQVGDDQDGFFDFYAREVLPRLRASGS